MKLAIRAIACIGIFGVMAVLLPVANAAPPTLTVPFPTQGEPVVGPASYIRTLYTFGLGFGTLLAMVMIVIGAIQYTVSEVVPAKEDAKSRIMSAIWGLVLLIAATLILVTINPDLQKLIEPKIPELPAAQPPPEIPPPQADDTLPQSVLATFSEGALVVSWGAASNQKVTGYILRAKLEGGAWLTANLHGNSGRIENFQTLGSMGKNYVVQIRPIVEGKPSNKAIQINGVIPFPNPR